MDHYFNLRLGRPLQIPEVQQITIDGLPAATGATSTETLSGPVTLRLIAVRLGQRRALRLKIQIPRDAPTSSDIVLRRMTYSLEEIVSLRLPVAYPETSFITGDFKC
jgi:hypothetical protein